MQHKTKDRMMTSRSHLIFAIALASATSAAYAKPADARIGAHIPELRRIVSVANKGGITKEDRVFLESCINSKDPVLLSVAAWIAGELPPQDDALISKLQNLLQSEIGDMAGAFVAIAIEKHTSKRLGKSWTPSPRLRESTNPYLRIETTRILLRESPKEGREALARLREDDSSLVRTIAEGLSRDDAKSSSGGRALLIDERYELVASIIEGA